MITIDATNTSGGFNIGNTAVGDFFSYVSHDANSYTWLDRFGSTITVTGTGITVDGDNIPTGGTITGMTYTFIGNSSGNPDIVATGLDFALTDLDFDTSSGQSAERFWQTILDGDIGTYLGPVDDGSGFFSILAGDFGRITEGNFEFADDDVFTGAGGLSAFYGDGVELIAAQVRGGNDMIQGDFAFVVGDVQFVRSTGLLIAGDDTIRLTGPVTVTLLEASGDAGQVSGDGFVQGGSDVIDLSASTSLMATIVGDVSFTSDRAVVTAGEDNITGTQQGDFISGDVEQLRNDAALFAANDTIYGAGGDDEIYGDVANIFDDAEVKRDGDDFIDGGTGADSIFGNGGDDTLRGGRDADLVEGGDGADVIVGGQGRDTLRGDAGDDNIKGSKGRDRVEGGDGTDLLDGGTGDDNMFGNAGNDTLIGGEGNDKLAGGNNADTFVFEGAFGNDTIGDFSTSNNSEKIDLSGVAEIADFTDLLADHIDDSSGTVVISDGLGNSITLTGVAAIGDLDSGDFLF